MVHSLKTPEPKAQAFPIVKQIRLSHLILLITEQFQIIQFRYRYHLIGGYHLPLNPRHHRTRLLVVSVAIRRYRQPVRQVVISPVIMQYSHTVTACPINSRNVASSIIERLCQRAIPAFHSSSRTESTPTYVRISADRRSTSSSLSASSIRRNWRSKSILFMRKRVKGRPLQRPGLTAPVFYLFNRSSRILRQWSIIV